MRTSPGGAVFLALSSVLLGGCVGIAHMQASVPEVQLTVRGTSQEVTVDLVCATYYGAPEGFVAVVNRTLMAGDSGYDWKRVRVGTADEQTTCGEESRYIGFPAIMLVPTAPRPETTMSRTLFVHVWGERVLYRLQVRGRSARVESTSLDDAERRFPARLKEPEPMPRDPRRTERIHLRGDYYRSTKWRSSRRLAIPRVEADRKGTISSLIIEVR